MPHLEFLVAREQSLAFELTGDELTVGRLKANTVQINETNVSGRHAELTCRDGVWYCRDLHSTNGTYLNGERLAEEAVALENGDFLTFASIPGIYRAASPGATPDAAAFATDCLIEGQYRVGVFLGESPGCDNFRAADIVHGTQVVLKKYYPEAIAQNGGLAAAGQEAARIQAVPHPNLINPLALRPWSDGGVYLVSTWLESASLIDVLRVRGGKLTPSEALRILQPVAGAIDHVRKFGLVGLDLNPRPILLHFDAGMPPADEFSALLGARLEEWPAFTVKTSPLLVLVDEGMPPELSRVARGEAGDLTALALLVCELFGYTMPQGAGGRRPARIIIPALGDAGNAVLARAFAPQPDFEGAAGFVQSLAEALRS